MCHYSPLAYSARVDGLGLAVASLICNSLSAHGFHSAGSVSCTGILGKKENLQLRIWVLKHIFEWWTYSAFKSELQIDKNIYELYTNVYSKDIWII